MGGEDGSSRCSSSAGSSRSRCTAPAARRPRSKVQGPTCPPAGEDQHCQMSTSRATWLRRQAPRANLQRRRGVGRELLLCFSPHRPPSSSHHTRMRACLLASGPSVCSRGAALGCLIGHFPLRRSLNIVHAHAQARSRSSRLDTQVRTRARCSSSRSTPVCRVAAAAAAVKFARGGRGTKRGQGRPKSRVRDPPRQPVFPTPTHHARPTRSLGTLPGLPLSLLASPVGRWEAPHHRAGVTMFLVDRCMRGCRAACTC